MGNRWRRRRRSLHAKALAVSARAGVALGIATRYTLKRPSGQHLRCTRPRIERLLGLLAVRCDAARAATSTSPSPLASCLGRRACLSRSIDRHLAAQAA